MTPHRISQIHWNTQSCSAQGAGQAQAAIKASPLSSKAAPTSKAHLFWAGCIRDEFSWQLQPDPAPGAWQGKALVSPWAGAHSPAWQWLQSTELELSLQWRKCNWGLWLSFGSPAPAKPLPQCWVSQWQGTAGHSLRVAQLEPTLQLLHSLRPLRWSHKTQCMWNAALHLLRHTSSR